MTPKKKLSETWAEIEKKRSTKPGQNEKIHAARVTTPKREKKTDEEIGWIGD